MSGTEAEQNSPWKTVGKLVVGFAVIFALSALLGVYFNEPLEAFGTMLIDEVGNWAVAHNVKEIRLVAADENLPGKAFYCANGFSLSATMDDKLGLPSSIQHCAALPRPLSC